MAPRIGTTTVLRSGVESFRCCVGQPQLRIWQRSEAMGCTNILVLANKRPAQTAARWHDLWECLRA